MLVRPHEWFERALRGEFALPGFGVFTIESAAGVILAAEELSSPVVIETSEAVVRFYGLAGLSSLVHSLAEEADCPVALHLSDAHSFEMVQACVEAGYASVMIDGAGPDAAGYAHNRGVWVEAWEEKPEGADALVVEAGTVAGAFTGQEYIQFDRLAAAEAARPGVPLVLRGASGVAAVHIRQAAAGNVCKISLETDLVRALGQAEGSDAVDNGAALLARRRAGREAVKAAAAEKIRLFGSAGQSKL